MVDIGLGGLLSGSNAFDKRQKQQDEADLAQDKFDASRRDQLVSEINTAADFLLKNIGDQLKVGMTLDNDGIKAQLASVEDLINAAPPGVGQRIRARLASVTNPVDPIMAAQRAGQVAGTSQVAQVNTLTEGGVPAQEARAGVLNNRLPEQTTTTGTGSETGGAIAATPENVDITLGQGFSGGFTRGLNNLFQFIGAGAWDKAALEAEVVGKDLRVNTINLLAQDIGSRPTNFSREQIAQTTINPESFISSPEKSIFQAVQLQRRIEQKIQNADTIINDPNASATDKRAARTLKGNLAGLRADYGNVISSISDGINVRQGQVDPGTFFNSLRDDLKGIETE